MHPTNNVLSKFIGQNFYVNQMSTGALPSSCNCSDIVLGTDVTIDGIQDLSPRHYRRVKHGNTGKYYWRLCKSYTSSTISSVDCDWTGEMIPSNNMAAIWKSPRGKRGTFWVIGPFRKLFKRIVSFWLEFEMNVTTRLKETHS